MGEIFKQNADEDGFLYCRYTAENIFGAEEPGREKGWRGAPE